MAIIGFLLFVNFIQVPPAIGAIQPVTHTGVGWVDPVPSAIKTSTTTDAPATTTATTDAPATTTIPNPSPPKTAASTPQSPSPQGPTPLSSSALPPPGMATAWGCGAALAYLTAYAAPTYQFLCPGDAQGHDATTCLNAYPCSPGQHLIIIAVPCPAAYMNEAYNSWSVLWGGVVDPFGSCHQ